MYQTKAALRKLGLRASKAVVGVACIVAVSHTLIARWRRRMTSSTSSFQVQMGPVVDCQSLLSAPDVSNPCHAFTQVT